MERGPSAPTIESVDAVDSTRVDPRAEDDSWGDDATKTDGEAGFEDETPYVPAENSRDLGVVVTAASSPGNGMVITRSRSALLRPSEIAPHRIQEIDVPTQEEPRAVSDLPPFEPEELDPAEVMLLPRPANEGGAQVSGVTLPPAARDSRKYTFTALLAAVAFGFSFGLVCGLLLARLFFSS